LSRSIFFPHGDNDVFAFFVVEFGDTQDELVLAEAELRGFADGQQDGVFIVFRTNAINDVL